MLWPSTQVSFDTILGLFSFDTILGLFRLAIAEYRGIFVYIHIYIYEGYVYIFIYKYTSVMAEYTGVANVLLMCC